MRSLAAQLTTAQRARTRTPYLKIVISDANAGATRIRPATWYTGAEAAGPHAVAVPTDGSLIRLRIEANTLYRQRVTTPGAASNYTVWVNWRAATRLCAIAQYGANLVAFAVDNATPTQVYTATSADNGATWSAFALAFTQPATITAVAAAAKANGDIVCVNADAGANINARKYTGGAWGANLLTADGVITANGVAVHYSGDYCVTRTGALIPAPGSAVQTLLYGDGFSQAIGTWSGAKTIQTTAAAPLVAYSAPFSANPSVHRMLYREAFTGTTAYDRIVHSHIPPTQDWNTEAWREPEPFNLTHAYGLAIAQGTATLFLTTPSRVYAQPAVAATVDVTARVISAELPDDPPNAGTGEIILDNADGTYALAPPEPITIGAEVTPGFGYLTSTGNLSSNGPSYWISAISHTTYPSRTLKLTVVNAFGLCQLVRLTRSLQYVAGAQNLFNILRLLFARAGVDFSGVGSSQSANLYPAFAAHPGENVLTAIRRAMKAGPDTVHQRAAAILVHEPLAADASVAPYSAQPDHANNHEISAAVYVARQPAYAHARAAGGPAADVHSDNIDYTAAGFHYTGPAVVADRNATTAALTDAITAAAQRNAQIAATSDELTTPVHCGLEVNDVIDLTDNRLALVAAKRRVLRITTRLSRAQRPGYEQKLLLGAP